MIYDDSILPDEDMYLKIMSEYSKSKPDRTNIVSHIFSLLSSINNKCMGSTHLYNSKINDAIKITSEEVSTQIENLTTLFNITQNPTSPTSCSIFSILSDLLDLNKFYFVWLTSDEKEYYKNIAKKHLENNLNLTKNFLDTLNHSYIKFFKFM